MTSFVTGEGYLAMVLLQFVCAMGISCMKVMSHLSHLFPLGGFYCLTQKRRVSS